MKKTFLTFAFVAVGSCVAFAQTTPVEEQKIEQNITIDRMSDKPAEEMAGRRAIKPEELPVEVQRALNDGEFKDWKVIAVSELQASNTGGIERQNMSNVEGQADAQANTAATTEVGAVVYEVELISKDMKDELKDSKEQMDEVADEAASDAAVTKEEKIEVKVPGVVLRYDAEGKLLSRTERVQE